MPSRTSAALDAAGSCFGWLLRGVTQSHEPVAPRLRIEHRGLVGLVEYVVRVDLQRPRLRERVAEAQVGRGITAHAQRVARIVVALARGGDAAADAESAEAAIRIHACVGAR